MGFSRQEYWSGVPLPSPGDLPNPGVEPGSPALQADALLSEPPQKTSQVALVRKNSPAKVGDTRHGFDPWSGRSPGGGNGNPLQYFCLENSTERGTWQATVHRVAKSQTQLSKIIYLLQYCFCSVFSVFWQQGIWDLSYPTRNRTHTPCIGRQNLNHWTSREVLEGMF